MADNLDGSTTPDAHNPVHRFGVSGGGIGGCPKTKRQVAEASEEWVKIRLMDLADSPYSTTAQKISALEYLGKNLGMF